MKTFDDVKKDILNEVVFLRSNYVNLDKDSNDKNVKNSAIRYTQMCDDDIDNIDEATVITIGRSTNQIIELTTLAVKHDYYGLYFKDFDKFCDEILLNRKSRYCILDYYNKLGLDKNDLLGLKPYDNYHPDRFNFGDDFRKVVNLSFGTSIPMAGELVKAQKEYEDCLDDKSFIRLCELRRDAGKNSSGPYSFAFLSNNERYQQAKYNISKLNKKEINN
ncbi:MAG: hypothetical protein VZS44_03020 [Bacilli bacterium]|nr:hypothetical protein [Bacilli bacterium]